MSQQGTEENKTEEATPHKLRKARERGQVARGADLGFVSMLLAAILMLLVFGPHLAALIGDGMALALGTIAGVASGGGLVTGSLVAALAGPAVQTVLLIGLGAAVMVAVIEIIQLRGIIVSAHPLKPDFGRLNPMQGLKRIFSVRTLKETLKSILKMALYAGFGGLAITLFVAGGRLVVSGPELGRAMHDGLLLVLGVFAALSLLVAAIDQVISRTEFAKEMRMSRSELDREHKEHEGEPRQKQKRRQLHAEYARQTRQMAGLPGSDMLVVNPQHVAVGLAYDPERMEAPQITALGRNKFALLLKSRAAILGIPIIHDPPLARALHAGAGTGEAIRPDQFVPVARHYLRLRELCARQDLSDAV